MKRKPAKKRKRDIETPDDLKKVVIMKDGSLMDIDEWTRIPAPGTSKTEDAEFEIVEPKQLPNTPNNESSTNGSQT